jgi:hypothetical protein
MNTKTFALNRFASRLLRRFLQQRIVAEEPVVGSRIVNALEERRAVRDVEETPRSSLLMSDSLQIPQIGIL